ncbi:MAG: metalloregulator ArsR/SmtB family transcription factor [Gammaproteobacteria bacterium]
MDIVFKALADQTRRSMLDRLFERDGQNLGALVTGLNMSRQAVSKHLGILIRAGLVVVDWKGREKRHYLNAVPIREIHDRWVSRYAQRPAAALVALKKRLEEQSGNE